MPVQDARANDATILISISERKENRALIVLRTQVSERDPFFSHTFRYLNEILQKIDGECGFPFGIAMGGDPLKTRIPFIERLLDCTGSKVQVDTDAILMRNGNDLIQEFGSVTKCRLQFFRLDYSNSHAYDKNKDYPFFWRIHPGRR